MPKKVWTLEERKAASERAKARMAERNATATAVADPEPEAEPTSQDVLKQLAGLFAQASNEKSGRDKAINEALEVLGRLDPMKYPDIASNPTVTDFVDRVQQARLESTDVPPGTIIGTGLAARKKDWTPADLLKSKDMKPEEAEAKGLQRWVVYTPIKTTFVGWNGLHTYFRARQKIYTPQCFIDVFEESLNLEEFAEQHAAWLQNVPGIPYHVDFGRTNGPRVKAMDMSHGEYYVPNGGVIDLTPDPNLAALSGAGAEDESGEA